MAKGGEFEQSLQGADFFKKRKIFYMYLIN